MANLKELLLVLTIAVVTFIVVRPVCVRFMAPHAFRRRRNAWLALTIVAFVSPSFWLYLAVAGPLIIFVAREEDNPLALYLFLAHVISPVVYQIPAGGIMVLGLSQYRVLAFLVLLPWFIKRLTEKSIDGEIRFVKLDIMILSLGMLQLILVPSESLTSGIRRAIYFFLDTYILYYVASRSCVNRERIVELMACLCVPCAIFAPLAVFETMNTWALYLGVDGAWGSISNNYVFREGALRALVSAGHPLGLGYFMAIGLGFWLYLRTRIDSRIVGISGIALMIIGLVAPLSRAPWIVGLVVYVSFLLLSPLSGVRFVKPFLIFGAVIALTALTPLWDRFVDMLPFIGTVETENVLYRQRLAAAVWTIVQENPFFGDSHAIYDFEDIVNHSGIIDMVNGYAQVALSSGLVGLALFIGFQLTASWLAYTVVRKTRSSDSDFSMIGASLLACMFATMVYIASSGAMWMQNVIVGLLAAYASIGVRRAADAIRSGDFVHTGTRTVRNDT